MSYVRFIGTVRSIDIAENIHYASSACLLWGTMAGKLVERYMARADSVKYASSLSWGVRGEKLRHLAHTVTSLTHKMPISYKRDRL